MFAVGTFLFVFLHLPSVVTKWAEGTRGFQWDGVILMTALFLLILAIQTARNRLRSGAPWTTLAFALAAIAGLLMKFGFMTIEP
ncbi:MAG: hypothetical protein ABR910_01665 [Acidobacteriaceae bacterium]